MPNRSKNKGDREERSVVNEHRNLGFDIQRTLESGARSDGTHTHDIDLNLSHDCKLKGECKLRASGFKQIYDWIEGNDFLTIRADRKERLYVIPERVWTHFVLNLKDKA